jgi:hypothetical protein
VAKKLTKKDKAGAEEKRISKLTVPHNQHFKIIFSHQIEGGFGFRHIRRGNRLMPEEVLKVYSALGKFIDAATKMTITDVENVYGRDPDRSDGTYDPESKSEVEMAHVCLFRKGDDPVRPSDSVRLHGYYRTKGGYFVVTRMDWFHSYHDARV